MTTEYLVTLVHGTFVPRAGWTRAKSIFRTVLAEELAISEESIATRDWDGYNTQRARRRASEQLKAQIIEQTAAHPNAKHFVIAHSHAGNIALYALEDPDLQSRISGIVCLNTPFISVTSRHTQNIGFAFLYLWSHLIGMFFFLAATVCLFALLEGFLRPDLEIIQIDRLHFAWIVPAFLALGGTGVWLAGFAPVIDQQFQKRRDELVAATRQPSIHKTKVFCVWNASDEVYGAFSTLEGLANLPYILMHGVCVLIVAVLAAALGTLAIAYGFADADTEITKPFRDQPLTLQLSAMLAIVLVSLSAPVLYLQFLIMVALILNFVLRILPVGLSVADFYNSFFVRISFALTPQYAQHVEFREVMLSYAWLNHSTAHSDPDTVRVIANWIKSAADAPINQH
jgi:hypothetical protein